MTPSSPDTAPLSIFERCAARIRRAAFPLEGMPMPKTMKGNCDAFDNPQTIPQNHPGLMLIRAVKARSVRQVRALVLKGTPVIGAFYQFSSQFQSLYVTPFEQVLIDRHPQASTMLRFFIDAGAPIHKPIKQPLSIVSARQPLNIALEAGAWSNALLILSRLKRLPKDPSGLNPVFSALHGYMRIMTQCREYFIKSHPQGFAQDKLTGIPIDAFTEHTTKHDFKPQDLVDFEQVMKRLFELKADFNQSTQIHQLLLGRVTPAKRTPLHFAAADPFLTRLILQYGANTANHPDEFGTTPLMLAASHISFLKHSTLTVFDLLTQAGADPGLKNSVGLDMLHSLLSAHGPVAHQDPIYRQRASLHFLSPSTQASDRDAFDWIMSATGGLPGRHTLGLLPLDESFHHPDPMSGTKPDLTPLDPHSVLGLRRQTLFSVSTLPASEAIEALWNAYALSDITSSTQNQARESTRNTPPRRSRL